MCIRDSGMVGKSIRKKLIQSGYGSKDHNGLILNPSRRELDLLNYNAVENWFNKNMIINKIKLSSNLSLVCLHYLQKYYWLFEL